MGDFSWLSTLFTAADGKQNQLAQPGPNNFVSVNVSVVTNEMGGSNVMGGTVSYAVGSLVYQPGVKTGPHKTPPSFASVTTVANPFFSALMRKNLNTDAFIDKVALSISMKHPSTGGTNPTIAVWFVDALGNATAPQNLTGVDTGASVLYGVGPGVTGPSAVYAIAPFNPQIQNI